jgi:DNA-binding CsgD family transcriptional regulator/tetratricopeptide (TPR) repeat protein
VPEIVSREEELASLQAFIGKAEGGPAALVLEGGAGIGKSTLWRAGVELGRKRGLRVLSSRPAEAERSLGHVGLGDLFDDVLDDVLPALSAPRRRALEVALLREETLSDPIDPRALGTAVRNTLQLLAEETPVLIAIDDVQWFDNSSAHALAFALRRLTVDHVGLLLARRLDDTATASRLEQALGPWSMQQLLVRPLSLGALHRLLRGRFGRSFARQALLRIHKTSGGNPFFALELARVLNVEIDPVQSVPETLEQLVRQRIADLPTSTREALVLAAAVGTASEALLVRAGAAANALDPAIAAHVIERDNGTVRFTHPLLSSVLYMDLGEKRRAVHGRIARVVDDRVLRARHLALSRDAPDAGVAGVLDEAVTVAAGRGASAVAAELAEQALRLTPPAQLEQRHRRALGAARAHHAAGEWTRARTIATDLLAEAAIAAVRVEALVLLAELEGVADAIALLEEALREASARPALRADIHCRLAWATRFDLTSTHVRAALELAEEIDDDVLRVHARAVQAILGWFAGDGAAPRDLPALARDFAPAVGGQQLVQEATLAVANTLAPSSVRGTARAFFEREHEDWREQDEPRSARALWGLAWVEFWGGRWELAAAHAASAHDVSIQYGLEVPQDHLPIAIVAVHRGQLERARAHSERALVLAGEQLVLRPPQHMGVLGLVALWSGDVTAAHEWLGKAERRAAEIGWGEPSLRWWTSDYAESLLEHEQIEDAVLLVDLWQADAERVGREWVLAQVTRCRGLVAAAQGNLGEAGALLDQAIAEHHAVGDPYGRARALLALGIVRRRERQKRASRDAIAAALSGFEQVGAGVWIEKARTELGKIGGRRRETGLTPAERRVAALVAEGRTNREVAAALFLGERTVASHLTHIYAKLGLRSRTELARRLH